MKMHQGLRYAEAVVAMLSSRFENANQEAYANGREQGMAIVPSRAGGMKFVVANWRNDQGKVVLYAGKKDQFSPQNLPSDEVFGSRLLFDNPMQVAEHIEKSVA